VLKISMNGDLPVATLKLEGKLVGAWARELERTWQDLCAPTRQKPLRVDICEVTFADGTGTQILREIVRTTGAQIVSDSPLTQYFADQATSNASLATEEK
jgi:anti-anti-sigma regulatory factor